mgnify:CR=1 FL=1
MMERKTELTELNYVDEADKVIQSLFEVDKSGKRFIKLSTSKLRKLLGMISDIYNEALRNEGKSLGDKLCAKIQYMKMHFIYEAGREPEVKKLIKKADIINKIDSIGSDKKKFINFCHYMEALVAYKKFYAPDKE